MNRETIIGLITSLAVICITIIITTIFIHDYKTTTKMAELGYEQTQNIGDVGYHWKSVNYNLTILTPKGNETDKPKHDF